MSDFELSMSVPLDSERFMRRACPTCERELKWRVAEDDAEGAPVPEGGYFCPYCAVQGSADSWWTEAQLEAAEAQAYREVVKPQLEDFADSLGGSSGGLIDVDVSITDSQEPPSFSESDADDMRRVDFPCHPEDPVKVLEDWGKEVHCLICGEPTPAAGASGG